MGGPTGAARREIRSHPLRPRALLGAVVLLACAERALSAAAFMRHAQDLCSAGRGAPPPRFATMELDLTLHRLPWDASRHDEAHAWHLGYSFTRDRQRGRPFGGGETGELPAAAADRARKRASRIAHLEQDLARGRPLHPVSEAHSTLLLEMRCERVTEAGSGVALECPLSAYVVDAFVDVGAGEDGALDDHRVRAPWGETAAGARLCRAADPGPMPGLGPGVPSWRVVDMGGNVTAAGSRMGAQLGVGGRIPAAPAAAALDIVRAAIAGRSAHETARSPFTRAWAASDALLDRADAGEVAAATGALGGDAMVRVLGHPSHGASIDWTAPAVASPGARSTAAAFRMAPGVLQEALGEARSALAQGAPVPAGLQDLTADELSAALARGDASPEQGRALEWLLGRRAVVHSTAVLRQSQPSDAAPPPLPLFPLATGALSLHRTIALDWLRALRHAASANAQHALYHLLTAGPGHTGASDPRAHAKAGRAARSATAGAASRFGPAHTAPFVGAADAELTVTCACDGESPLPARSAARQLASVMEAPSAYPATAGEAERRTSAHARRERRRELGLEADASEAERGLAEADARTVIGGAPPWADCDTACAAIGGRAVPAE